MTLTADRRAALIGGCPLFRGLDDSAPGRRRRRPRSRSTSRPSASSRAQGEIGTGFFIVVDGQVRVVRDGTTVARLGPGEFFGELSVLDGGPRVAQVAAEEPTTLPRDRVVGLRARAARRAGGRPRRAPVVAGRLREVTTDHRT